MSTVSHKPVAPVEDPAERRGLVRPAQGDEGLYEGEGEGGQAEHGVGVGHDEHEAVGPAPDVQEYQHHPGYGPRPDQHHQQPVPDKPLSPATPVSVPPRVFVISERGKMHRFVKYLDHFLHLARMIPDPAHPSHTVTITMA